MVRNKTAYGVIDKSGKEIVSLIYPFMGDEYANGLIAFSNDDEGIWGFLDLNGEVAIEPFLWNLPVDPPLFIGELCMAVNSQRKRGYINTAGNWAIEAEYDWAYSFSDGVAGVQVGEERGFIDSKGKYVIPLSDKFEEVSSFYDGLANVSIDQSWNNYINKKGKLIWKGK